MNHGIATDWHEFADADTLAGQLATEVANLLRDGIVKRGIASLIVSGGRSPIKFFAALSRFDLAWGKVTICLADERWVGIDSVDSNEKNVRDHLLVGMVREANFITLKTIAADPEMSLVERTQALLAVARPFDIVMLGMGEDGHTASLFPGSAGITGALDPQALPALVAIAPPFAEYRRISMNISALLDARHIAILIQGENKRAVLDAARNTACPQKFPIAAILHQARVPVAVYWSP